jgi:hypothetical protein
MHAAVAVDAVALGFEQWLLQGRVGQMEPTVCWEHAPPGQITSAA